MAVIETIGVGVISFDRPSYLRRLVASLEQQAELEGVEFHLFQDGAVNRFSGRVAGDEAKIDEAVRLFARANVSQGELHRQRENVGVGINQFEAYEWLTARYEWVVVLEDDVVLSPHWLRLIRVLFRELEEHGDVFGFSTAFRRQCGAEEIEAHLGDIVAGTPHWWMIGFLAERWRRIRPHFLEYYELIREIDYAAIPHAEVRALFERKGWGQMATSQDGGKDMAVHAAGMERVVLAVNRGISIGRRGIHFTPDRFRRMGFEQQMPYIFESDGQREGFEWPA